jgi:dihydroorotate dehydrogenase (NAD+) catalytic subunit
MAKEKRMNLAVEIAPDNPRGLKLNNPVIMASGTYGYGMEFEHHYDIQRLGAIVSKGIFLKARDGNLQPRITETASGILNAIGLQGIGVEALIREKAPVWAQWQVPVIVNIAGNSVEEYGQLAQKLEGVPGVSGIEVNISCPNIKSGGVEFGTTPEAAARVTAAVRCATSLPVWVKLTPNTAEVVKIAQTVAEAGADAVVLINTLKGMAIDIKTRRPVLGNITGGLSGPAIKPVALRMVYEVFKANKRIPVIGCGGIMNWEDALEFIMAGATAVQIGSANLIDPLAPMKILEGLQSYLVKNHCQDIRELVGIAQV